MKNEPEDLRGNYRQEHHKRWGTRTVLFYGGLCLTGLPLLMSFLYQLVTNHHELGECFLLIPRHLFLGVDLYTGCHGHTTVSWGSRYYGHPQPYAPSLTIPLLLLGILIVLLGGMLTREQTRRPTMIVRRAMAFVIDWLVVCLPMTFLFLLSTHPAGWRAASTLKPPALLLPIEGHLYLPILVAVLLFSLRDWRFWIRPGRLLTGTRVVGLRGKPCTIIQSVLRNMPLVLPVVPWYAAHQLLRGRPSRLGERLSNTKVVDVQVVRQWKRARAEEDRRTNEAHWS